MDTQDDLNLPEGLSPIDRDKNFTFTCGPDQPCFNRCCAQLHLFLTPYDCLRLTQNLEMASEEFLRLFTLRDTDNTTGFPIFTLRMIESPDAPCPFVTPAGCSVYEDRPGACRAYPLGRGAKLGKSGVEERFFMIQEEHCAGFDCAHAYTPHQWFKSQELPLYNNYNDRYMRLLSMVRASDKPVSDRLLPMIMLSLWQPDHFFDFLKKMNIQNQIKWDKDINKLKYKNKEGLEATLDFGLSWLELIIFGQALDMYKII